MIRVARRLSLPLLAIAAVTGGARFLVGESRAELDNLVFTSTSERLRVVVPRGWRATDQPSYPGLLLWMMRSQPPGQIVMSAEPFTRALYCSWPAACRASSDAMPVRYACAVRSKLGGQRLRLGPVQPGPKDNLAAGLPSVWFEYDDGRRFLRQAIAMSGERAVSLVLSAPTAEARATHARAFDQTLRTLEELTAAEAAAATPTSGDAGVATAPGDGAAAALVDAPPTDAGFTSAPAPRIEPVGPCPDRAD